MGDAVPRRLARARARVRGRRFRGGARRSSTPGAGQGAVEVPLARVAVVHDAGRLDSPSVTFLGAPVKVS
ncbi:hypothetical protein ABB07_26300 [Streptomyces incarnatus]|uniref:Uncharacterized protein n=1 Tax=Streptomyces incarnatus TaxID=665007 RepID=A0ABN4GNL4_9ACTN|nr:hypothetical protein ABB07_26300 [Streptomyces incarnatus]